MLINAAAIPLRLQVHRPALWAWWRAARRRYPTEAFGYLIGRPVASSVFVAGVWLPRDIRRYSHTTHVEVPRHWFLRAYDQAHEEGLQVVGCVHSHPDDQYDGCPSKTDLSDISGAVWGITVVKKRQGLPRVVRTDWYGPVVKVEVAYA